MGRAIAVCLLALWLVPAERVTAQEPPSVELSGGYALLGRLDVDRWRRCIDDATGAVFARELAALVEATGAEG